MAYNTIKIAGTNTVIDKNKFAANNPLSKEDVFEDAQNIFELYDTNNGLDTPDKLDVNEQNNLLTDIETFAGDDAILSDEEIVQLLTSKGLENLTEDDINSMKYLISKVASENKSIYDDYSGPRWNDTTRDLSMIESNMTFNLDGEDTSVTITKYGDDNYYIQNKSLFGDKVEFLNRKPDKLGKNKEMKLIDGDEITVGDQVWIYNDGKLENTGLDKDTYKELFPKGINGDNLKQGAVGDCFLIATLSKIADNPNTKIALARLFSAPDGLDGDIYVRFPGYEGNPIKISKEEIEEMKEGFFEKIGNAFINPEHVKASLGFMIIEKAYGQLELIQGGGSEGDKPVNLDPDGAIDSIDNGGNMKDVIKNILGIDPEVIYGNVNYGEGALESVREKITEVLDKFADNPDDYIITLASLFKEGETDQNFYYTEDTNTPIAFGHAYNISRVDKENGKVYIENPWNTSKEICLTYDEFIKAFSRMTMAEV